MSQSKVHHAVILKFFVYNCSWGCKEGTEEEKVIYYWSKNGDVDMKVQISDCGLAEGVVNFVKNFCNNDKASSDAIHGLKTRFVLHEIEPNYWSAISIQVPHTVFKTGEDNQVINEYHQDRLNDHSIKLLLKIIYYQFRFRNGPISRLWSQVEHDREKLRATCKRYFNSVIPHLKLVPINLLETYSGIQYLPLDNLTFMMTQSFINHVNCIDTRTIRHVMFLYNDQLVSSSLTLQDTKIVYSYLTSSITPEAVCEEINDQPAKTRWLKKNCKVHLHESEEKNFEMFIYRSVNGSSVILFLNESNEELVSRCEAYMCTQLVPLTTKLTEAAIKINNSNNHNVESVPNDSYKFVYFNASNAAYKSNTSTLFDHRKLIDSEFAKLIIDFNSDLSSSIKHQNICEIVTKSTNDSWVIVHHSDARSFFSILNHKNANLIEATDTVKLLTSKQFKNILFVD